MRCEHCLLTLALLGIVAAASPADAVTYNFYMDTAPLVGEVAGPFSLEFQLNDGSGTGDGLNPATLSDFNFGGGATAGAPSLIGGATGDASTSISITESSFFNQFIQPFTPGSELDFQLSLSTNVQPGPVPDQFTFSILDSTGSELPTLSFFDVFVEIDIDSGNPSVLTFPTDTTQTPVAGGPPIDIAAPIATLAGTVPEPESGLLLMTALGCMLPVMRRRRRQSPTTDPV